MTVYSYARVSSVEQAAEDRSSLDTQLKTCAAAATIAKLPEPVPIVDPGVSGSVPLSLRPSGGEMCKSLRAGDVIIAAKLDRLFRSASDALLSVERMKSDGVRLILVDIGTEPVTESAVAKMFLGILASVAEFEKMRILERMDIGRKEKRKNGGHIGGKAPYGYRKVGAGKSAMLEREESEQSTIALVKRLHDTGISLRSICRRLSHMGIFARSGSDFAPIQIARILESKSPEKASDTL